MTKILTMSKRILVQLLRDPRTLLLIFIAPLVVLTLLKYVFAVNTNITAKVATIGVEQAITNKLEATKGIDVVKYSDMKNARKAMSNYKIDTIINRKSNYYDVIYANNNIEKTNLSKQAFKVAIENQTMCTLKDNLKNSLKLNQILSTVVKNAPQLARNIPVSDRSKSVEAKSISRVKIKNHYVYGNGDTTFFDTLIPGLMSIFVFLFVFMISGVALLNERVAGTLERLLATPIRRSEIVISYFISYGIIAVLQTIFIVLFIIKILHFQVLGNVGMAIIINVLVALVALALGLLMSVLAKSQFQMMQFIPIVIVPQVFFTGIVPVDVMPKWVQMIGDLVPVKYAADALTRVMINGAHFYQVLPDIVPLLVFVVVLIALNIVSLKKYRKV